MRALVTGAAGFAGQYLVALLLEKGYEVCGTYHKEKPKESFYERCYLKKVDVLDKKKLRELIEVYQPDEVYHLAGIAATTGRDKEIYYKVNFTGSLNLFECVQEAAPHARVLYVGSANSYGPVLADRQPIKEDEPLNPVNHYAASKAAADLAACAFAAEGLYIVRARPFNHTGPGQSTAFVCSRLAKLIAEISLGLREPVIEVGNLDSARDFTDVRDVVRAYWMLLEKGRPGEAYNICAQKAYTVREVLSILTNAASIEVETRINQDLLRGADISIFIGNRKKISKEIGWSVELPFEDTLENLLKYWRQRSVK